MDWETFKKNTRNSLKPFMNLMEILARLVARKLLNFAKYSKFRLTTIKNEILSGWNIFKKLSIS